MPPSVTAVFQSESRRNLERPAHVLQSFVGNPRRGQVQPLHVRQIGKAAQVVIGDARMLQLHESDADQTSAPRHPSQPTGQGRLGTHLGAEPGMPGMTSSRSIAWVCF